jgi:predicted membrane protein
MSLVFVLCAIAIVFSFTPLASSKPATRPRELDKYARRMGIAVPADIEDRIVARLIRRERALLAGGLTGIILAVLVSLVLPGGFAAGYVPVLVFGGLGIGSALGAALASSSTALIPPTGPRVARPTTPVLGDYVPTLESRCARLLPAVALAAVAGAWIAYSAGALGDARLTSGYIWTSAGAWLAYASVAALLVAGLLSRRILDRGQPASSATDLAWNDALRAQALRDLHAMPVVLGLVSALSTFFDVGSLADYRGDGATAGLIGMALLLLLVTLTVLLTVVGFVGKPQQHFWRRLWSDRSSETVS